MRHCLAGFTLLLLAACATPSTPATIEAAASKSSHLVGTVAPAFTLQNQASKKISLADYKGKWVVLYFFGHEDTPGCTCGANEFTDVLLNMLKVHATVLAINDALPDDNQYSSDQYGLEVTVLSDPDAVVMSSYKIRDSIHDPIIRQTFLIDPTGRIAWHWPTVVADAHGDRINAKIKELGGQ